MNSCIYECDGCAACCIHLWVPVFREDLRHPTIALNVVECSDGSQGLGHPDHAGCPMLENDGRCSIYLSKPVVCNVFKAGSEQCQWARGRAGLGPLQPKG